MYISKKTAFINLLLILALIMPMVSTAQNRKIAVFGSSVAKGFGDTTGTGGYGGMIKALLEKRGWSVVNVSRGGDNTVKIMPRFEKELLPEKPGYVIIGLSLGNEGIASQSALTRNRVFERFRSGMMQLVNLCRENGMQPVIVNCYARNDFGPEQYDAVKKMNLLLDTWNVPVINSLGAIDDGNGHWAEGYWHDKSHPNEKGHREIYYSFVPSLFDAMAAGKKCPEKLRSNKYLSVSQAGSSKPLLYVPGDSVHSFAVSFQVKSVDNGTIAAVHGKGNQVTTTLKNGRIILAINGKEIISADTTSENIGWQYITLSHCYATGTTSFYVNGKISGTFSGTLHPEEFILGGSGSENDPAPNLACYRDLLIYRSALNPDEVQALYYGQLLQASLEIYAPLNDNAFIMGTPVKNHAQSMSELLVRSARLTSANEADEQKSK